MHPVDQTIIQSLIQIRGGLSAPQPLEPAVLGEEEAMLERLSKQLAAAPELAPVITLVLAGVQTLQTVQDRHNPPSLLLTTLVEALAAMEQFMLSDASPESKALLDYAHDALRREVCRNDDETVATGGPPNGVVSEPQASAPFSEEDAEADPMGDLIKEFLLESYENLDRFDQDLLALEQDPSSQSTLAHVFRTIHTIKGTCGFFGFTKLESLTHAGESLLSRLRDGRLRLTADITTGLLALEDAVRQLLDGIRVERREGDADYSQLVELLKRLQQQQADPAPVEPENAAPPNDAFTQQVGAPPHQSDGPPVTQHKSRAQDQLETAQPNGKTRPPNEQSTADDGIRVNDRLPGVLTNLIGELMQARDQILQYATTQPEMDYAAAPQRLNLTASNAQEGVMKARAWPVGLNAEKFEQRALPRGLTTGVAEGARNTTAGANGAMKAAEALSRMADELSTLVVQFKD